jgi:pyridoxal phosphate enzyme (YggS family)
MLYCPCQLRGIMTTISANLQAVENRIAAACAAAGRSRGEVLLLAVSKTWPALSVRAAALCGQRAFGENYVQEGIDKMDALGDLALEWHFIGPLQSNKTKVVAERFDWVHGVDRLRIAERLSAQRPPQLEPLQVCLQVNLSEEPGKSGAASAEIPDLARAVANLPRLRLRGLMTLPEADAGPALLRQRFAALRVLRDDLNRCGLALDTLSMGMSDDLEAAIAEGASIVRVGRAIFGERRKEQAA